MDIRKLQRAIVDGLEEVKAHNIVVFNTEHLSPLFERVIIASGTSNRQTKALASSVRETVKARGLNVLRTEGEENGEWIIVDCGAAVVHLMQPAIRDYYHLEELWGDKSVRMKLDGQAATLVKASTPAEAPAPRHAGAKASAPRPAPKPGVAKSAAPRPAGGAAPAPSRKVPAGKPAARKTATGRTATGKTAARKPASPKTAARKTVVRKVVAKKAGPRA